MVVLNKPPQAHYNLNVYEPSGRLKTQTSEIISLFWKTAQEILEDPTRGVYFLCYFSCSIFFFFVDYVRDTSGRGSYRQQTFIREGVGGDTTPYSFYMVKKLFYIIYKT